LILQNQRLSKEQVERIQRKCAFYRNEEGEKEIFNMMLDCKMFQPITEKDVPLRNYALQRLTELGFNQEDKVRMLIHEMLDKPVLDVETKTGDTNGND